MAIDAKIKRKWLAALRSGKYNRVTGQLAKSKFYAHQGHCCLGVLAEIVDPEQKTWHGTHGHYGAKDNKSQCELLGGYISGRKLSKLVDLNDSKGKSFKEIAKFIAADRFI